jgi:hypothetical protein
VEQSVWLPAGKFQILENLLFKVSSSLLPVNAIRGLQFPDIGNNGCDFFVLQIIHRGHVPKIPMEPSGTMRDGIIKSTVTVQARLIIAMNQGRSIVTACGIFAMASILFQPDPILFFSIIKGENILRA